MSVIKPSLPKGTRDFSPIEMVKRNFIYDTIKTVFRKYGYAEIQTPSFENLSTLTGKYGDEGDKLIFKILNSGDLIDQKLINQFSELANALNEENWTVKKDDDKETVTYVFKGKKEDFFTSIFGFGEFDKSSALYKKSNKELINRVSEKALRYDLTVPFARYVVMHQHEITLPFKRFQVQPVWRADRPQKGRYREFYQCDVDVVGSESLLNEAEFILIYNEALSKLGLKDFTIKINNRKILSGIAEIIGKPDLIIDMTVAIDKLDKIGLDGVSKELLERGFTEQDLEKLRPVILLEGFNEEKLASLKEVLAESETGLKGIEEIEQVFDYVESLIAYGLPLTAKLELDITLARGLNYYTGCIFEVKTNEVAMGSIGGGGRYDDLTGMFGLKGLTGVGVSFGADRIYDVLEELNLFPASAEVGTKVLISNFDETAEKYALPIVQQLRNAGISAELYPSSAKLKKQMAYADAKNIPYVILIGGDEMASGELTLKDMQSGEQKKLTVLGILELLK
ncbi:histidyl-tRNA synthetase [Pedobacter suwonensis]|uniref:Histidine--tRNA ligase n=1 Tax=Pedobacter suwonensis TaxID=332999 RepID=A0A1I0TDE0_9SPHI|nr:histidine--tRNA ligase [Pedobacter suwonensis]SFA49805.1 histidyl-tRNA synthetase [Pedobacter suwonensis]